MILIVMLSINDIKHPLSAVSTFNIMMSVFILCVSMLVNIMMSVLAPKQYQVYYTVVKYICYYIGGTGLSIAHELKVVLLYLVGREPKNCLGQL
jgi:hypothetical protein